MADTLPSNFVWYELMTTDAPAARAFYADVVGWQVVDSGMPGFDYSLLKAGDTMVAGLMALPPEAGAAPPAWAGYVGVHDVDAKAAELQQAGGSVLRPAEDIPGVGRFALVADPHGAVFYLFKGEPTPGEAEPAPPDTMAPGGMGWHELYCADLPAALDFYGRLFGWQKDEAIDMGPMGTYQLFKAGAHAIGGMMVKPPEMPVTAWLYYTNVPAIDAAAARVKAGGGQVLFGPQQVPGGSWVINCMDPQGAMFALVAPQR